MAYVSCVGPVLQAGFRFIPIYAVPFPYPYLLSFSFLFSVCFLVFSLYFMNTRNAYCLEQVRVSSLCLLPFSTIQKR